LLVAPTVSARPLTIDDVLATVAVGLNMSRSFSGRRAKPDSMPKVIRWMSKRELLDYEGAYTGYSVSDRFRDLIEEIEPEVHQFEPIRFVAKDGTLLEDRWFWQITAANTLAVQCCDDLLARASRKAMKQDRFPTQCHSSAKTSLLMAFRRPPTAFKRTGSARSSHREIDQSLMALFRG
jgi:hypothetical protein